MTGIFGKKIKEFKLVGLSLGLAALALAPLPGNAGISRKVPQVFKATEDDGTAQDIRPNTAVDKSSAREETLNDVAAEEVATLKLQNKELKNRLQSLEKARAEVKAEEKKKASAAIPAPAPDTATAAEAADDATLTADPMQPDAGAEATAAAPVPAAIPAAAPVTAPIVAQTVAPAAAIALPAAPDPAPKSALDERFDEKTSISATARKELAKEQNTEAKLKEIREKATRFDSVPDKFIPDLAQRLKYTNDILKRFGRAYDYRITTLKDFKKILTELEAIEEKTTAIN